MLSCQEVCCSGMWFLLAKKRSWTAGESLHFIFAPVAKTEDPVEAHDESM